MNNIATLLEIYEQCRDIRHKRRNVAGFSKDGEIVKIPSLGLLITFKLFLHHINHPRSSHDHIHEEQHWIYTFQTKNLVFEAFENMGTKNRKISTINRAHKYALIPLKGFMGSITCIRQRRTKKNPNKNPS